ncbi:nuclear transport factor 2 family protein [Nocardioides plantarum]|uniref:Nuclear transport factor 2 family protein n=1 Tax=Nocardioides plantarum TaxID=29299 RepID=A0ABV5KFU4_9ACTN|nr:nuclear transport factor 2 family protein [Nocardioides plantarum]
MIHDQLHLTRYYAAIDRGDLDEASSMLHPRVAFAIHLPAGVRRGSTREELIGYLTGRGDVVRRHDALRASADGDLETVYGAVVDDGTRTTGHFLAGVRVDPDGLIAAYHVSFDTELFLLEGADSLTDSSTDREVDA